MNTKETSMTEVKLSQQFKKPIDYLVFQLKQQYYHLSDNELKLLALICLKGVNRTIKDVAVREGVFKSKQTVANALSKFRMQGILDRDDEPVLQADIITEKKGRLVIDISL
jgi:hypothetical protein